MSVDFVQVPPDSTGKRVHQKLGMELTYSSGTIAFAEGDIVVGATSGAIGIVSHLEGTTASGTLTLDFDHNNSDVRIFTNGENLQVGGVTNALAGNQTNFYTQKTVLAGGNDTQNEQFIDKYGQSFVRFAEGAPQLDAFGKLRVSQATLLGDYFNEYHIIDEFEQITASGGTLAHIPASGGVLFSTTTTSGSQAKLPSHTYHKYQAGISHLIEMTLAIGDTGKANVDRIWGYGDDDDGAFFRLNGTTLQTMIRNSTGSTAAVVAVDQADWNGDKLDGTGLSRFTLDVSKDNIYWMDIQWMGAGTVRFGVVVDGERIVCHKEIHENLLTGPYMRTGTLPVYFEQLNTGVAGSGSEMRLWCTTVKTEGDFTPHEHAFSGAMPTVTVTGADKLIGSFRSKQLLSSLDNRTIAYGKCLSFISDTDPVRIELIKNASLTGATWAVNPDNASGVEIDTAATSFTGGTVVKAFIVPGTGSEKAAMLDDLFSIMKEKMRRHYTITDTDTYTITATLLKGTTTDVMGAACWVEHH